MKKIVVTLIMILFISALSDAQAEKLVFTTLEDFPPYAYLENGQIIGIDADTIREVCKRLGIEPEFYPVPWKRALMLAERGDVSGMLAALRTKEREGFLYYPTDPVHTQKNVVLATKGSNIKITTLDDLKGKEVGVLAGFSYGQEIDNYPGLKKTVCNEQKEMIRILDKGRIDVALDSDGPFWFNARLLNLKDRFEVVYVITEIQAYTVFSKKALGEKGKTLAEKFSQVLHQIKEEGIVEQILNKYR